MIMEPTELRIGNFIQYNSPDHSICFDLVVGINYSDDFHVHMVELHGRTPININGISPIPITPEWLERLGFEWDIYYQGYCDGNYIVNIRENGTISFAYGKRRHDEMQFLPYIKYVHQLQNLYHAITGNELKIK